MSSKKPKILIAASGTGGHILPAIYVAEELKKLNPDSCIEFCGAGRPLEEKIIARRGYQIHLIPIVGVSRRGLWGKLQFLLLLPRAFWKTIFIFWRFRPNLVLGVGGYISVLPILVAKTFLIKTVIHEAEHTPGLANKFLSYIADLATIANQETTFPASINKIFTGQPLNPKLFEIDFHPPKEIKKILILGGSQGADKLDRAIVSLADFYKETGIAIKHQCRENNIPFLINAYQAAQTEAEVFSFSDQLPDYLKWADLIIARSGLNTVRELEITKRPAIYVPLPKAPEQIDNARRYAEHYPAVIIEEQDDLAVRIKEAIQRIQVELHSYVFLSHTPVNGSKKIADQVIGLIRTSKAIHQN